MDATERGPRAPARRARWWYLASALIAIAFALAVAAIWSATNRAPAVPPDPSLVMRDQAQVGALMAATLPASGGQGETPHLVPTGVFIESLQFDDPRTLTVSGYIWQRYPGGIPPGIQPGVVLPEADTTTMTEVYRTTQGVNETLVGWAFSADIRQHLDYSDFPLDRQELRLQLWSVDFEHDVYLTPDLGAYTSTAPGSRPGLDDDLTIPDWQVLDSYFGYRLATYDADFGIDGYSGTDPQPELRFGILVQRDLTSAIVGPVLITLVILMQLFVLVLVVGPDAGRLERFGVKPGAVIFTCAALFLTVLVAHEALRSAVAAPGIVYLETLPILAYAAIIAVAIDSAVLVAWPTSWLSRNDNLAVEVLFWPVLTGAFLLVTLATFGLRLT